MKYFSINELTNSSTATQKRIGNRPNKEQESNLIGLIENVLDPLRELYGKPIIVSSGFRCNDLNMAVGGAKTSQHMNGEAADIYTGTREGNKIIFDLIQKNLNFDQCIDEKDYNWIHVSYKKSGNRKQVLHIK